MLKKIEAIIREDKLNDVKEALKDLGIVGMNVFEIRGHGRQGGITLAGRSGTYQVDMLPKIQVNIILSDRNLEETIETILSRGYAEKLDGRLVPTKLGRVVTGLLLTHFPDIIDVAFTAAMEEQLDEVEEGDLPWRKVVRDFYEPFSTALENARKELERVEVPEEETGITCEACGRPMVVKYGRYGRFLACSGYPECRQTRPYAVATGLECPKCGAEVVEKRTRKGRRFYGCIRYPECDFSVWSRPVERKCPECGTFMVAAARGDGKPATARGRGGNGEAAARGGDGAGRDQDQAGTTRTGEGQVAEAPVRYVRCANEACGHEEIERPPA